MGCHRYAERLFRFARSFPAWSSFCLISRTATYGPVRVVVWEGGAVRLLRIPTAEFKLLEIEYFFRQLAHSLPTLIGGYLQHDSRYEKLQIFLYSVK